RPCTSARESRSNDRPRRVRRLPRWEQRGGSATARKRVQSPQNTSQAKRSSMARSQRRVTLRTRECKLHGGVDRHPLAVVGRSLVCDRPERATKLVFSRLVELRSKTIENDTALRARSLCRSEKSGGKFALCSSHGERRKQRETHDKPFHVANGLRAGDARSRVGYGAAFVAGSQESKCKIPESPGFAVSSSERSEERQRLLVRGDGPSAISLP